MVIDNQSVLHIDDDPQFLRIVARQLEGKGYKVTSLCDPRQAKAALSCNKQQLVLLDIDMPYVNGLELLLEIKQEFTGTQVIMLTGMENLRTAIESLSLGADFCIFKPLKDMEPLIEVIEKSFWKIEHWWKVLNSLAQEKESCRAAERKLADATLING